MVFGFIFYFETGSLCLVLASLDLKGTFLPSKSLFIGLIYVLSWETDRIVPAA